MNTEAEVSFIPYTTTYNSSVMSSQKLTHESTEHDGGEPKMVLLVDICAFLYEQTSHFWVLFVDGHVEWGEVRSSTGRTATIREHLIRPCLLRSLFGNYSVTMA